MNMKQNFELYEQLEDLNASIPAIRNVPEDSFRRRTPASSHKKHKTPDVMAGLAESENELNFSYSAAKHEKIWLTDSLKDFYQQQWFDDILRLIKGGGKEASVYQCLGNLTTHTKYLAAKVYRPRQFRQLRNDALYREGRLHLDDEGHEIQDGGALHAIRKRTNYGMRLMHTSWIEHEFQTMTLLHKAGADIPEPYVSGNNAILMEYIGDDDVPAPTLNMVNLTLHEAQAVFKQAIRNVEIMLAHQRVHGDLSAYNLLYHLGEIVLIDFPQSIDPKVNRNAYGIFRRDITRLCEYFQAQGLPPQGKGGQALNPAKLAEDLWLRHGYTLTTEIDPRIMDPEYSDDGDD